MPLRWRDAVHDYQGTLRWDGDRHTVGWVTVRATDHLNGRILVEATYPALAAFDIPGLLIFSFLVYVPGSDSRVPGAHSHSANLVFSQQPGGGWQFVHNCDSATGREPCYD